MQKRSYSKWFYLGKSGCFLAKVIVIGQRSCIWAKVYSGKRGSGKMVYKGKSRANVVLGQKAVFVEFKSGRVKVVVFGQKWFYLGKSGFIRTRWLFSG